MTLKKIITIPEKILRKKSIPITIVTEEINLLLNEMLEIMYNANGIGLAANQIGDNRRLIVMDCGKNFEKKDQKFENNPLKMINPRIIYKDSNMTEREEGCLSIPGFHAKVKRPSSVKVSYLNEYGKNKIMEANGLLAACVQHEIDHLDGILFIDYLSKLKKEIILKKALKKIKTENR